MEGQTQLERVLLGRGFDQCELLCDSLRKGEARRVVGHVVIGRGSLREDGHIPARFINAIRRCGSIHVDRDLRTAFERGINVDDLRGLSVGARRQVDRLVRAERGRVRAEPEGAVLPDARAVCRTVPGDRAAVHPEGAAVGHSAAVTAVGVILQARAVVRREQSVRRDDNQRRFRRYPVRDDLLFSARDGFCMAVQRDPVERQASGHVEERVLVVGHAKSGETGDVVRLGIALDEHRARDAGAAALAAVVCRHRAGFASLGGDPRAAHIDGVHHVEGAAVQGFELIEGGFQRPDGVRRGLAIFAVVAAFAVDVDRVLRLQFEDTVIYVLPAERVERGDLVREGVERGPLGQVGI